MKVKQSKCNLKSRPVDVPALAEEILKENRFALIVPHGCKAPQFYRYIPALGVWETSNKDEIKHLAAVKLEQTHRWSSAATNNIYIYIRDSLEIQRESNTFSFQRGMKYNFANGVLNWNTMELQPHQPNDYFTSVAPYNLELGETPETDKYIHGIFGENAKTIMEFVGYGFYPSYEPINKMMFLVGGGVGKTTFNKYLAHLMGVDNCGFVDLMQLSKGRNIQELCGKSINAVEDYSNAESMNTYYLERLVDLSSFDLKKLPIPFCNTAKLWFASETLKKVDDTAKSWGRRVVVVDFNSIKDYKNLDWNKINEERGAFAYKCIHLAKEAIKRGELTSTSSIENKRKKWVYI